MWADAYDRLPALAAELVVAASTSSWQPAARRGVAAKARPSIPIMLLRRRSRTVGLAASINRPGGNVTGVSFLFADLGAKRLNLLRELLPRAAAVGLLVNPSYPSALPETRDVQASAKALGVEVSILNAGAESDFEPTFAAIVAQKLEALLVGDDPFLVKPTRPARAAGGPSCRSPPPPFFFFFFFLHELQTRHCRRVSTGRRLYRANSQGREARQPTGHAAD